MLNMRACALVFFSLGVLVRDNTSKPDALGLELILLLVKKMVKPQILVII